MAESNDKLTRFFLERANVRGVLVQLHESWQQVASRAEYPTAIAETLAQCLAASALFSASLKINGRLSIQMRGQGSIRTLFTECTTAGTLRGIAHFNEPVPEQLLLEDFGADAVMAITIENEIEHQREPQRYQGMVSLQAETLGQAFEQYFSQSEQLPTRIVLFATKTAVAGMLIQQLPQQISTAEDWNRCGILLDTLTAQEMLNLDANEILYRLFHEEDARIEEAQALYFACSCSQQRVEDALISLGQAEIESAILEQGELTVHCDFCGQAYRFDGQQSQALFWPKNSSTESHRLH
jgi:molecular chaperone Hsp33